MEARDHPGRRRRQHQEGWIESGGVAKDVRFEDVPAGDAVQRRIDVARTDRTLQYPSADDGIIAAEAADSTVRVLAA